MSKANKEEFAIAESWYENFRGKKLRCTTKIAGKRQETVEEGVRPY